MYVLLVRDVVITTSFIDIIANVTILFNQLEPSYQSHNLVCLLFCKMLINASHPNVICICFNVKLELWRGYLSDIYVVLFSLITNSNIRVSIFFLTSPLIQIKSLIFCVNKCMYFCDVLKYEVVKQIEIVS